MQLTRNVKAALKFVKLGYQQGIPQPPECWNVSLLFVNDLRDTTQECHPHLH